MAHYVILFNYTQQGIEHFKQSPHRVELIEAAAARHKIKVKQFFALMGRYDTMLLVDAPNDEAAAALSLAIGAHGNARSETMRAFEMEEFKKIVAAAKD